MPPKTLCLILFNSTESDWLLPTTAELATALDAHLIAVHPYAPLLYVSGIDAAPAVYPSIVAWEEGESAKLRTAFDHMLRINGLSGEFRSQQLTYGTEAFVLSTARAADLVIMRSSDRLTISPDERNMAERIIRQLGRPVLLMTQEARLVAPAKRSVIAWTDTREATRAAHDCIPLMSPGASVEIVSMIARAEDNPPGLDGRDYFAAALDRQGFKATVTDRICAPADRATELQALCNETGADLLVAGAFGHSYLHDLFWGAVTRDLVTDPKLPLLIAH